MTQWVERPEGGRDRGPVAVARAWLEVLVRPRRFFRTGVAPGDQAPGLVFAAVVVLAEEGVRFALVPGAFPVFAGQPLASAVLALAVAAVLVTPAVLHLTAALVTVELAVLTRLAGFAPDRGGVGETVQVLAYAAAPCALAGVPGGRRTPGARRGLTAGPRRGWCAQSQRPRPARGVQRG
jgi:hypothetical protein